MASSAQTQQLGKSQESRSPEKGAWATWLAALVFVVAMGLVVHDNNVSTGIGAVLAIGCAVWIGPRVTIWALLASAILLFTVGGTVTTYRVGLAVPDWPTTFGESMFAFPMEEMLANFGVAVEHSHRLLGAWVGVLAIGVLVSTHVRDRRSSAVALAWILFLAICFQGYLGGSRVLERRLELAFLHGSLAQAVFGLAGAVCVVQSLRWRNQASSPCKQAPGLHRASLLLLIAVYSQIVLGAWLRHSGQAVPLGLHAVVSFAVVALTMMTAACLRRAHGDAGQTDRSVLMRERARLLAILGLQFALGIAALVAVMVISGGFDQSVSKAEAWLATLHVVGGALFMMQAVSVFMWSRKVVGSSASDAVSSGVLNTGGAGA